MRGLMFNNNNGTGNSLINDISAVAHDASAATIINLEKIQEISAAANSLTAWGRGQYKRATITCSDPSSCGSWAGTVPGANGPVIPPSVVQALPDGTLVRITMQAGGGRGAPSAADPDSSNIMGGGGGMGGEAIRYFATTPFGFWQGCSGQIGVGCTGAPNNGTPSWIFWQHTNAMSRKDITDSSSNPYLPDGTGGNAQGNSARAGARGGLGISWSGAGGQYSVPYPWTGGWRLSDRSYSSAPSNLPEYEMKRARIVQASPGGHGTRPQSEGGVAPGGHGGAAAFGFSGYGGGGRGGDGTTLSNAGQEGYEAVLIFEWFE